MIKSILLTFFYLLFFNFLIYRFKAFQFKSYKPFVTYVIFNVKFVVGIFIWIIYTFYYKDVRNNDVHKFYSDALILHETANENPQAFCKLLIGKEDESTSAYTSSMKNWERNFDEAPFNENRTIIRLNALLMFVSLKTYFVHILFFCFISLIGWILLTNSIFSFADARNSILALPVLFLPSVLFWTSGVMKEPLLVLGLGLCISSIINYQLSVTNLVKLLCGLVIILFSKFFVLACLFPALTAYLLFRRNESQVFVLFKYATVTIVFLIVAFSIHYVVPQINLQEMLVNKQTHSIKEAVYFKAGSQIAIPELKPDATSIIKTSAVGIWNTIMRPYIWEGKNVMMLASAVENVFLVTWLLMCVTCTKWKSLKNLNLFLFLLTFSLAYFALVGMCTPVLGNLVRYKTPLLPLFMFAFILLVNPKVIADSLSFVLRK